MREPLQKLLPKYPIKVQILISKVRGSADQGGAELRETIEGFYVEDVECSELELVPYLLDCTRVEVQRLEAAVKKSGSGDG